MSIVLGVDPGLTGALTALSPTRGFLECHDLPVCDNGQRSGRMMRQTDAFALEQLFADLSLRLQFAAHSVAMFIERPIAMPGIPSQVVAAQFDTFGVIRALAERRFDQVEYVNPRDWKQIYGLKADKTAARQCAQRLYASAPVDRVKDHNRAESVLIAHYGLRRLADG